MLVVDFPQLIFQFFYDIYDKLVNIIRIETKTVRDARIKKIVEEEN